MAAITYTYSQQHRPFPTSGNTLTEDGSPLHSRLGLDVMTSINNLAYSMPFAGFVQSYNTYTGTYADNQFVVMALNNGAASAEEWFAAQLPTVMPNDAAVRFCWTLGMKVSEASDAPGTTSQINAVTVYLSRTPYVDIMSVPDVTYGILPTAYRKFDTTKLEGPYSTSSKTTTITATHGDPAVYYLIDNSAGTTGTLLPFLATTGGGLSRLNLIITTTAQRTAGSGFGLQIEPMDFSWWLLPE